MLAESVDGGDENTVGVVFEDIAACASSMTLRTSSSDSCMVRMRI